MSHHRPDWDSAYRGRDAHDLSWFEARPDTSLDLLAHTNLPPTSGVVDVGAGSSPFLQHLSSMGWADLTAVDLSAQAMADLHLHRPSIKTDVADICDWRPGRQFDLWHDRAALHFLTEAADRAAYVRTMETVLRPNGYAIIGTFAPDGPDRCFGQPVRRYDGERLSGTLGEGFDIKSQCRHVHLTPGGTEQRYFYALVRRKG